MSNIPISKMNDKQLRNEVQLLRDELAIFKRKYEDIIYNLDNDNFSSQLIKEKEGMKTSIEQTEKSITLQAEEIEGNTKKIGTLEVTAGQIQSTVKENYDNLNGYISSVSQTANSISSKVGEIENGKFGKYSLFTQTTAGFYLDGDVTKFTGVLYLTDDNFNNKASIYYGDGTDDMNQEYIAFWTTNYATPMVFGYNPEKVYIGNIADGNQVATRDWVLENGGVAKFA